MPKIEESNTDIVFARVDAIVVLILENERYLQSKRNKELADIVMQKFECKDRTAYTYISQAKREIRKIGNEKKEKAFKKAMRDREWIIQKSKTDGDTKTALLAMKDRDELIGLYKQVIEHSGTIALKNFDTSRLTDDQMLTVEGLIKRNDTDGLKSYLLGIGINVGTN